jgi:hypothetical protein
MSRLFNVPECSETSVTITVCLDHQNHCSMCGVPATAGGHFVGGSRPDARIICDPAERASYLARIRDTATLGRRYLSA